MKKSTNIPLLGGNTKDRLKQAQDEAKDKFFKERVQKLCTIFFPEDKIHPEFKELFHKLLKFNNYKQMGVHMETYRNMIYMDRQFFMPEMEICLEVMMRATPKELSQDRESDEEILRFFYEERFPKLMEIVSSMKDVYDNIDQQISKPIADKINSDCKISLQIPITSDIKFVIPNSTAVKDGK